MVAGDHDERQAEAAQEGGRLLVLVAAAAVRGSPLAITSSGFVSSTVAERLDRLGPVASPEVEVERWRRRVGTAV